jgi:two-component system sensor histidine kinase/response regulator
VVVLDWQMPGMNGLQTAQRIQDLNLPVPPQIAMVTAYSRQDLLHQAANLGMSEVMTKPVNPSTLLDSLTRLMGGGLARGKPGGTPQFAALNTLNGLQGVCVLLAEDNPLNQQVACEMLANVGVKVSVANNGHEAVAIAGSHRFDAILMDMQMPVMDGLDATRTILALPDWVGTPIIAMTANAMAADRKRCLDAGMVDFVAKPVEPDQLFTTLVRWTAESKAGCPAPSALLSAKSPGPQAGVNAVTEGNSPGSEPPAGILPAEIAGLDMVSGLRRMMGREDRYIELLKKFVAGHGDACDRISQAMAEGQWPEAERIAHTLKGLAGTIGATSLHDAAEQLEQSIGHPHARTLLSDTDRELASIVHALKPLLDGFPATTQPVDSMDAATQRKVMDTLLQMLRDDDANAQRHFASHLGFFRHELGENFQCIQNALDDFALDNALDIMEAMRNG